MAATEPGSYYDRVNPDLLVMIPASARAVLEVGCGTGALGAEFLRGQPQARYYGVEMNEEAAATARSRLAAVASCDIEKDWNPHGLAAGALDVLIFGDVLEHLRDPWTTLSRLSVLLRDGGLVVACIPNIGHWSIVAGLLAGRFNYAEEGLLDRTHLRFFTLASIVELLRCAGLTLVEARARRLATMNQGLDKFLAAAAPLSSHLGVSAEALQGNLSAFQYVITAAKGPVTGSATPQDSATGSCPSRPASGT
jgi:SAM-dependent methyltransferase